MKHYTSKFVSRIDALLLHLQHSIDKVLVKSLRDRQSPLINLWVKQTAISIDDSVVTIHRALVNSRKSMINAEFTREYKFQESTSLQERQIQNK
jgi:hypothetical protein